MSFHLITNRKSLVGFQNMRSDLKFGAPRGEIGMTSLPVIETHSITPKPLQIGVSFLLTGASIAPNTLQQVPPPLTLPPPFPPVLYLRLPSLPIPLEVGPLYCG